MQFMVITHATKEHEAGIPPSPELMAAIGKKAEEGYKSGKIIGNGGLLPTSLGARLELSGGKINVTDGPFTECKELVGGFAIMKVDSKEEAVEMCKGFLSLHTEILGPAYEMSCEIRQMYEPGGACLQTKA